MFVRNCLRLAGSLGLGLAWILAGSAYGQLLNSWEGSLEGWTPQNGHLLSVGTVGATQGSSSLQVQINTQGFQRWGARQLTGTALTDITTAAANPNVFRIQYDVTYSTASIPQGSVSFINQQLAMQTSGGWSQVDFLAAGDQRTGTVNETITISSPLSRFASLRSTSTSVQLLMATNSDWGAGVPGTIFVDNLRISRIRPDLNQDTQVNAADWAIFMANHLTSPPGTSTERFLLGDLDSNGVNDFNDFIVFEAAYDYEFGGGAFREMLATIPEPASWLVVIPLMALVRWRRMARRTAALLGVLGLSFAFTSGASAQLLHSWETGLEGWNAVNFGTVPLTVATSNFAASQGTQSLALTHGEDGFSWSAQGTYGSGSPNYNTIGNAATLGLGNFALEFDVIYDTSRIPQSDVTFINMSVALNSAAGWRQYDNVGLTTGIINETVNVSIPLSVGDWPDPGQSGWYQINLAVNGDWGLSPATIFVDNMRLRQVTIPETLGLEVDRGTGAIKLMNPSASNSFSLNYYRILSPGGSLDVANWNSLDAQGIGNTGGGGPLDGWTAAGGSSANSLAEAFLLGQTTMAPGSFFNLGNAYRRSVDAQDLVFQYQDMSRPGQLQTGSVTYVGSPPTVTGDFNDDGLFNCTDVNSLVVAIVGQANPATFDLTGDGVVNQADLTAWLAVAGANNLPSMNPYRVGDANLDGVVDGSDFGLWNSSKFTATPAWCSGDFNADGVIDGSDFGLWNTNKFQSADGLQAVPEPSGLWGWVVASWLLRCALIRGRK